MELRDLYYLIAVAETGSMRLAAERLHVSQQNISRVLTKFGKEIQVTLFNKSNSGCQLTPDGENVYLHALKIISDVQMLENDLKRTPLTEKSLKGNISVYYSNSIAKSANQYVLPFVKNNPDVVFSVVETTVAEIFSTIYNQNPSPIIFVQLALEKLLKNKDFLSTYYECFLLLNEPLKLLVDNKHPLAKQTTVSLKKMSSYPFAIRSTSINNIPEHAQTILDLNIPLTIKYCSNSESSLLQYVSLNQACCLTTNTNLQSASQNFVIIPIRERIYVSLCVLLPKTKTFCVQQFCNHILNNTESYMQKLF